MLTIKAVQLWRPNSSTPEPDRPQQDRHAAYVVAQQYSSATFVSLRFHSGNGNVDAFKKWYFSVFALYWNCLPWNCISRRVRVTDYSRKNFSEPLALSCSDSFSRCLWEDSNIVCMCVCVCRRSLLLYNERRGNTPGTVVGTFSKKTLLSNYLAAGMYWAFWH